MARVALEISLLGPPRVALNGSGVSFDTRKATALLAHLALAERLRSREALCDLLWPGQDPERARAALRRTLSTVRTAIGEEWLDTSGDGVALRQGRGLELDVARFRALARDSTAVEDLLAAVDLCRGELLEGFGLRDSPEFDAWHVAEADTLRRELSAVLGRVVGLLGTRGEHARAIPYAQRWLEVDPLHEPAHRELIRLYAWSGDRGAALRQYRECVRTLSNELGVAPLEETAALFEQVSEGTLAPHWGAPPSDARPEAGPPPSELALTGRASELDALVAAHRDAAEDGRLAVVEGEAGIGKTRLGTELVAIAAAGGAAVLTARCHDGEAGLPYAPVTALLRRAMHDVDAWVDTVPPQQLADASLLVPELAALRADLPRPLSTAAPGAQTRLLEALAGVLAAACTGKARGVLFVDDVHAADGATLDALAYLGRRLHGRPLLLLLSWRSEGLPPGHSLRRLAGDLAREGTATVVSLSRLDEEQVAELVRAARPGEGSAELARRIYLESEGLPLFVAEYMAALRADGDGEEIRGEVRGVLSARLADLGQTALQVLGAAAVIGRTFDSDTVRAASGRSEEETVDALEQLVANGVIRELDAPEPGYDFAHQRLRALVYEDTSLARRRLLHRRVAAGLPGTGETAAIAAQHLRMAGDHAEAAALYQVAAEHAVALVAHADALEHLEAALALGAPDPARLHERIGDLRTLVGDYTGALASYERAAADSEEGALASLEQKLGGVHGRRGEWDRSEARLVAALDAAPPEAQVLRARIAADLALVLHHQGRHDRAGGRAHEALELSQASGDEPAEAQAHNMLGVLARTRGNLAAARTELELSAALAEQLGDAPARAAALNNLALVERDAGELNRARELTETALRLCQAYGDRHREAALENNLADLHHAAGREDEAMAHLKRAIAIFTEVGADEATRLPEIWKLVSW